MEARVKFISIWPLFGLKRLVLVIVCPGLLMCQALWLLAFTWTNSSFEMHKRSAYHEKTSDTKKISGINEHTIINLNEVNFVLSDEQCFQSYEGLPENKKRAIWLEKALNTLEYEGLLHEKMERENGNRRKRKDRHYGRRLEYTTSRPPSGPTFVAEYRAALSFALEQLRLSDEAQNMAACSFPNFTKEESRQLWQQAVRRRSLDATCSELGQGPPSHRGLTNNLYWDLSSHLAYCALFKVGSTSWMSRMLSWRGIPTDDLSDEAVHELMDEVLRRPSLPRIASELHDHQPLLFMVHRHPFVRLVSAYTNKILAGYRPTSRLSWIDSVRGWSLDEIMQEVKHNVRRRFPWLAKNPALDQLLTVRGDPDTSPDFEVVGDRSNNSSELTFREFARVVIIQLLSCSDDPTCLRAVDEHWQPQHAQCSPCFEYYDVITAMHTFTEDTSLILKLVDRTGPHSDPAARPGPPAPQLGCATNCSRSPTSAAQQIKSRRNVSLGGSYVQKTLEYFNQLSAEERRLLFVANLLDFSLFGYSPDVIE